MADPSLLQSFSEDVWMSVHMLPHLHTLLSHCVGENFHLTNLPSTVGKAWANFITNAGRRAMSTEITPLAILVMDVVGKESWQ